MQRSRQCGQSWSQDFAERGEGPSGGNRMGAPGDRDTEGGQAAQTLCPSFGTRSVQVTLPSCGDKLSTLLQSHRWILQEPGAKGGGDAAQIRGAGRRGEQGDGGWANRRRPTVSPSLSVAREGDRVASALLLERAGTVTREGGMGCWEGNATVPTHTRHKLGPGGQSLGWPPPPGLGTGESAWRWLDG